MELYVRRHEQTEYDQRGITMQATQTQLSGIVMAGFALISMARTAVELQDVFARESSAAEPRR